MPNSRLRYLSHDPLNAETHLPEHTGVITPTSAFYKRNHFSIPDLDAGAWRLSVEGEVERRLSLSYADLLAFPRRTLTATLECAGNGRQGLEPSADGEPWGYGAVSTAEWTGVPLRFVLEAAGMLCTTATITVEGADRGQVAGGQQISYARGMSIQRAIHPDTLLAYSMNGEPLLPEHGFPARLIVPGWYGMAAVKWVVRLTAGSQPFQGFYQVDRYVMVRPGRTQPEPLQETWPRSLFSWPEPGAVLSMDEHRLRGYAWSGSAPISEVEVSTDGGASWSPASFTSDRLPYTWRSWELTWRPGRTGPAVLQCRARGEDGAVQPSEPIWNRLGYCNNAVQSVQVTVA